MSAAHEFQGRIYQVGILRCVDLPRAVGDRFAAWRNAPVEVAVGAHAARTRLVSRGDGLFRVFLDTRLRKGACVDTGDTVKVTLRLDTAVDREPFPDDLLEVAAAIDGGMEALMTLPPGLRRQVLKFLGEAKSASARAKRRQRIHELLKKRVKNS